MRMHSPTVTVKVTGVAASPPESVAPHVTSVEPMGNTVPLVPLVTVAEAGAGVVQVAVSPVSLLSATVTENMAVAPAALVASTVSTASVTRVSLGAVLHAATV
jgi:hypothetical protein